DRCSVVEVMGRHAGHIALQTGIAVGATAILVPEVEVNLDDVVDKIKRTQATGKQNFIVVVAEGVGNSDAIAKYIEEKTGVEARVSVLGHVQRGGTPTVRDRLRATQMANAAVHLLANGIGNRVVAYKDNQIVDYDIFEALNMKKEFDFETYRIANETSI
ncbi:MAG: 6-phosphofructokinase, partial [Clostridia bacterium]|nr:6-phosphofructokinase [Clostridia bacterium]